MRTVRLGEIAESLPCDYGEAPVEGAPAFDVVKVSNVDSEGKFHGEFEKRRFRDDQLSNLLVNQGELLVVKSSGSKTNILSGKTAICGADRAKRIVASNFLLRLRLDESAAVPRFVWYVLNSGASKAFVKTIVGASTYPNLKWSRYASHPIPLPSLAEQRRIADLLDRAESLRAKRRIALAQLDSLTQSIFLYIFGDPIKNPGGFPVQPLIELIDPERPISYGILMPGSDQVVGVNYVRVVDMKNGGIDLSRIRKTTTAISNSYRRSLLSPGDLLLSIRGHVGRLAVVPAELDGANITQDTARLAIVGVSSVFVRECLRTTAFQRWMEKHTKGVAVRGINLADVKLMPIIIPPQKAQDEFAHQANAVQNLKGAHLKSLAELDALFYSLQHRAFKGTL